MLFVAGRFSTVFRQRLQQAQASRRRTASQHGSAQEKDDYRAREQSDYPFANPKHRGDHRRGLRIRHLGDAERSKDAHLTPTQGYRHAQLQESHPGSVARAE